MIGIILLVLLLLYLIYIHVGLVESYLFFLSWFYDFIEGKNNLCKKQAFMKATNLIYKWPYEDLKRLFHKD